MTYLITGGLGYIGSHLAAELLSKGKSCILFDNLSNTTASVLTRLSDIPSTASGKLAFVNGDVTSRDDLDHAFSLFSGEESVKCVFHMAGLKSVVESSLRPMSYWTNNVCGSVSLLHAMQRHQCKKLIFSSSCTVYGDTTEPLIDETTCLSPRSPYGKSKLAVEQVISDICDADQEMTAISLRYFNPVGCHYTGKLGDRTNGQYLNLFPLICNKILSEAKPFLEVYGIDWPTIDGTCVRDYIHILDLVDAHISASDYLLKQETPQFTQLNIGTGVGYSVLQVARELEKVSGMQLEIVVRPRRAGEAGSAVADPTEAKRQLDWAAKLSLQDMCNDSWNWAKSQHS